LREGLGWAARGFGWFEDRLGAAGRYRELLLDRDV